MILLASILANNIAAEEEQAVSITGHKIYIDDSGLVHLTGIIENTGLIPVGFLRVTATLKDENGGKLPTFNTFALVKTLQPGQIAPFDIPISDRYVSGRVASYDLSLNWNVVDPKPPMLEFSGISAYTVTHMPGTEGYMGKQRSAQFAHSHEAHAHSEASGYVTNTSELEAKSVKTMVVWYDKDGQFAGLDWQTISKKLAPGERARFVFMSHPSAMSYYSVIAESDTGIAMLEQDGKTKIPIYESAKPDFQFAYLANAISISSVRLVDESSQPVSKVEAGKMVLLQSVMKNNMDAKQRFISIYQIKDAGDSTVMLFWMASQIPPRESLDAAISWIPEAEGTYTLQIFIWESMLNPVPLGEFSESTITVSK